MQFNLVLAALLCFTTWVTFTNATHGRKENCCVGHSITKVPLDRIVNYTIQSEGVCPISAVLVKTVRGITLCSDPESKWAKRAILKVDKDSKALLEIGQGEEGSANTMTPASSTASRKASKRRGRNGRRKYRRRGRKLHRRRA